MSRQNLALSKKSGAVREYLDELQGGAANSTSVDILLDTNSTVVEGKPVSTDDNNRKFERWLFSDWLDKKPRKKDAAIPVLKKAKWNSGDNPVLAATGLILLGVLVTSVTERIVDVAL